MSVLNFTRPFFNLELHEGSDFTVKFAYEDDIGLPVDLTGYSARLQVRINQNGTYDGYDVPYKVLDLAEFELSDNGVIRVHIPASLTLDQQWNRGVYDLFLDSPEGSSKLFMQGFITIIASATKLADNSDPVNGPPREENCQPDFTSVPEFD